MNRVRLALAACLMLSTLARAQSGPAVVAVDKPVVISWKELKGYLFGAKDEVVVVDCWATWCAPCVEALPEMQKVIEASKAQGKRVRVVLVSIDDVEDAAAVTARLQKAGVSVGSFIVKPEDRLVMIKEMSAKWTSLEVPAGFLFDRQGKKVFESIGKTEMAREWIGEIGKAG